MLQSESSDAWLPIENSPPGTHTIPSGAEPEGRKPFSLVGAKAAGEATGSGRAAREPSRAGCARTTAPATTIPAATKAAADEGIIFRTGRPSSNRPSASVVAPLRGLHLLHHGLDRLLHAERVR